MQNSRVLLTIEIVVHVYVKDKFLNVFEKGKKNRRCVLFND